MKNAAAKFGELLEIVKKLRGPDGCSWDKRQTPESLTPYLLEETYEVIESIEKKDWQSLKEELGDLLLHIVFQAEIGEELKRFNMSDIITCINEKMINRHPHVFGDKEFKDEDELLQHWENSKLQEGRESLLDGIPIKLPALLRAMRVQSRAAESGFDWDKIEPVWEKFYEEIQELKNSISTDDRNKIEEELGDLLFTVVNLSRWFGVNPEAALRRTVDKFIDRFRYIEKNLKKTGKSPFSSSLEEMDSLWEAAKNEEDN